jgi:hypothetical protein
VVKLVLRVHHASQINVRQVAELGLSDARITDDSNVEIAHLVFGGYNLYPRNIKSVLWKKLGLKFFVIFTYHLHSKLGLPYIRNH